MKIGPVELNYKAPRGSRSGVAVLTLDEVLAEYDVLDVVDSADGNKVVITGPKGSALAETDAQAASKMIRAGEVGSAGTKWRRITGGEEYNDKLAGHLGLDVYEKMRRGDATVRGTMRLAKIPVLGARWHVQPGDPEDPESVEQAEFIEWNLFSGMTTAWSSIVVDALLMLDYGHFAMEKVFEYREWRDKTRVCWRKLGPRHPLDIEEFVYDDNGGPAGIEVEPWDDLQDSIFIDIAKLLIFTYDKEAGNLEGVSLLRSAYKHWYFKDNLYKIDAIQKERHGIGIPMIKLPPNFTPRDKTIAQNMGKNLRTNELAHVVLPPMWEVSFIKVEGNAVNVMESIEHHDDKMYDNILAQFMRVGGTASQDSEINLFLRACRVVADIISDTFNVYAIPQLIDWNWSGVEKYPKLMVRRIGDTADQRTLSFALRNLVGAKIIIPDDKLEAWSRDEFEVPPADPKTSREIESVPKQAGTNVGLPRQGKPTPNSGTRSGPTAGNDNSGGE